MVRWSCLVLVFVYRDGFKSNGNPSVSRKYGVFDYVCFLLSSLCCESLIDKAITLQCCWSERMCNPASYTEYVIENSLIWPVMPGPSR